MSVRVIIKDVKKRTKACDECKRRKGRCDGGMPCEWCATRNLECVFSAFSQKRGPKKKRKLTGGFESDGEETDTLTLDKRELGMSYDLELNNYLGMFMTFFDPMFTMFKQWDKNGSKVTQLTHPRSYPQFITRYAACAIAARASGHKERASQLITEARSFAGHCFDEMTTDSLIGFMLLGAYWIGVDSRVTKHYYHIAQSIYSELPEHVLPANIRYIMAMSGVMVNNAISDTDKIKVYMANCQKIVAQNNLQTLLGTLLRVCIKTFAHIKCFDAALLRSDIVAVLICQVIFSERQRHSILEDLRYCRNLLKICHEIPSDLSEIVNMMFTTIEVFVEWRSGHSELALPLAIDIASKLTMDTIKFGNKFDVQHLLYISIFLREQQHLGLADKVRKTADALHTSVCETIQDLSASADPLANFLRRKPNTQSGFLPLTEPSAQESYNTTIDDNVVPTMVNNVLSLVSQLLPADGAKSLLTAQGLHLFYNTLSSIMPPSQSPYDISEEPAAVTTVIASTMWSDDATTSTTLSSSPECSSPSSSPNGSPRSTSSTPPITPPIDINSYSTTNTNLSPSSTSTNYIQTTFLGSNIDSTYTPTPSTFALSNSLSQTSLPLTMMFMFDNNDPATPFPFDNTNTNKMNTNNNFNNNNNNSNISIITNTNSNTTNISTPLILNRVNNNMNNNNNNINVNNINNMNNTTNNNTISNNSTSIQYTTETTTYLHAVPQQQIQTYIPHHSTPKLTQPVQPTIHSQNMQNVPYTYITSNNPHTVPQQQTQQHTQSQQHTQQQQYNTPINSNNSLSTQNTTKNPNPVYNQVLKNSVGVSNNLAIQFVDSGIVPASGFDWDWMDDWSKLVANPNP